MSPLRVVMGTQTRKGQTMAQTSIQELTERALYLQKTIKRFRFVADRNARGLPVDSPLTFDDAVALSHRDDMKLHAIKMTLTSIRTNAASYFERENAHQALMQIAASEGASV